MLYPYPISMQKHEYYYGSSAVNLGFHSNKRTTPYAAQMLVNILGRYLKRRRVKFGKCSVYRNASKKRTRISQGFSKLKINFLRYVL